MTNPLIRNYISCSENALKLTYSNVEFQNFPGEDPRTPRFQGGEGEGGGEGRKREGGRGGRGRGEGGDGRVGERRGREGEKGREVGREAQKTATNLSPPMLNTNRRRWPQVSWSFKLKLNNLKRRKASVNVVFMHVIEKHLVQFSWQAKCGPCAQSWLHNRQNCAQTVCNRSSIRYSYRWAHFIGE